MITFEQAETLAEECVSTVDAYMDYRDFYVFVHDSDIPTDGASGMVTVDKRDGRCFSFIAVLTKLSKQLGYYRKDASGAFVASEPED